MKMMILVLLLVGFQSRAEQQGSGTNENLYQPPECYACTQGKLATDLQKYGSIGTGVAENAATGAPAKEATGENVMTEDQLKEQHP